jgi:hypothetical protein
MVDFNTMRRLAYGQLAGRWDKWSPILPNIILKFFQIEEKEYVIK